MSSVSQTHLQTNPATNPIIEPPLSENAGTAFEFLSKIVVIFARPGTFAPEPNFRFPTLDMPRVFPNASLPHQIDQPLCWTTESDFVFSNLALTIPAEENNQPRATLKRWSLIGKRLQTRLCLKLTTHQDVLLNV